MSVVSMRKLLESGVHFGHQTRRWNPKMKPNIYTSRNGVYIINLEKTMEQIEMAYSAMKIIAERGGKVLFVGTKKQAQTTVVEEALRSGSFFVNQRWLGGLLTNYRTIQKRVKRLVEIEELEANGTLDLYTKKEVAHVKKQKARLENFLGGIKEMKKLPNAVFVIDPKEEHNAVAEAKKLGIPVFAMIDTNCDPETVDFPIASNDDAVRSVKLISTLMADAIVEAKGGLLSVAHNIDENETDVTMEDVIINVEEQIAENDKRRRQRNEERRNRRPQDRRMGFGGNASRPPYQKRENVKPTSEALSNVQEEVKNENSKEPSTATIVEKAERQPITKSEDNVKATPKSKDKVEDAPIKPMTDKEEKPIKVAKVSEKEKVTKTSKEVNAKEEVKSKKVTKKVTTNKEETKISDEKEKEKTEKAKKTTKKTETKKPAKKATSVADES